MENENQANTSEKPGILPAILYKEIALIEQTVDTTFFHDELERTITIRQLTDRLNDLFMSELVGLPVRCIGYAHTGKEREDNLSSTEGLIDSSGYVYCGMSMKIPNGHSEFKIMLAFIEDNNETYDDPKQGTTAYYIDPVDLLSIEKIVDPNIELRNLIDRLNILSIMTKSIIRSEKFLFANNLTRIYMLSEVHDTMQAEVFNFGGEAVNVLTGDHIEVVENFNDEDYKSDSKNSSKPAKVSPGRYNLFGYISNCLFYEYAMSSNPEAKPDLTTDRLKFDEPCLVVTSDTNENIKYYIPISKIADIFSND